MPMDPVSATVVDQAKQILVPVIKQGAGLFLGAEGAVRQVANELKMIRASIADDERRMLTEPNGEGSKAGQLRLERIRDLVYEIDDVLDEWRTGISKRKADQDDGKVCCLLLQLRNLWLLLFSALDEGQRYRVSNCFSEVCPCLPNCCYLNQFCLRCSVACKINSLNGSIKSVNADSRGAYAAATPSTAGRQSTREGPDIPYDACLRGRKSETKAVVGMVVKSSGSSEANRHASQQQLQGISAAEKPDHNLQLISIVGMAGSGKTTLARLVFADPEVDASFGANIKLWVSVSGYHEVTDVAKAILESHLRETPKLEQLPNLLWKIKEEFRGRKFLIVLNDVSEDGCRNWDDLVGTLRCGEPGSTLLVTTRSVGASGLGCAQSQVYRLPDLSRGDCWSIFKDATFTMWRPEDQRRVLELEEKICGACKGVPFFADHLRKRLISQASAHDYLNVLEVWNSYAAERFNLLLESYDKLDPDLRRCFSYCAVLPEDTWIEKDELIRWWSVQGYIDTSFANDPEVTASKYFRDLSSRSFLSDAAMRDGEFGARETFKVHGLVRDFADFVSKGECRSLQIHGSKTGLRRELLNKIRHLLVIVVADIVEFLEFNHLTKLHSLFVQRKAASRVTFGETSVYKLLIYLTRLRSLGLSDCDVRNIPRQIKNLIHLRWLDLSRNENLEELPEEICHLHNLEILCIDWCIKLEKLPRGMRKLVNLRHLRNYRIKGFIPRGVMQLRHLVTLSMFSVGDDDNAASLLDLSKCLDNKLKGFLCINRLRFVADVKQVEGLRLAKKDLITVLELRFDDEEEVTSDVEVEAKQARMLRDEEILTAMKPSKMLEDLRIVGYQGSLIPHWIMSIEYLSKLTLSHCLSCEQLPPLGKLASLVSLEIRHLNSVNKVGLKFFGWDNSAQASSTVAFPKVRKLVFESMQVWEGWDDETRLVLANEDTKIMPEIFEVKISSCPRLDSTDQFLARLKLKVQSLGGSFSN